MKKSINSEVPKVDVVKTPAGFLPNFTADYMIRYFYFADMKDWQYEDVTLASQVTIQQRIIYFLYDLLVLCESLASRNSPAGSVDWPNEVN